MPFLQNKQLTLALMGSGVTLIALIGYLLMLKSNNEKQQKKINKSSSQSKSSTSEQKSEAKLNCKRDLDTIDECSKEEQVKTNETTKATTSDLTSCPAAKIDETVAAIVEETFEVSTAVTNEEMKMSLVNNGNESNDDDLVIVENIEPVETTATATNDKEESKDEPVKENTTTTTAASASAAGGATWSEKLFKNEKQPPQQQPQQQQQAEAGTGVTTSEIVVYEFHFPRKYCGKLIGKNGVNVDSIRSKTNTKIAIRNDLEQDELQIVCISGHLKDVDQALDIISARFPPKHYPNISLKPITKPIVYRRYIPDKALTMKQMAVSEAKATYNYSKVLVTQNMFVDFDTILNPNVLANYGNGYVFDIYVTAVINAGHVFIQLPTHPSYVNQALLDANMLTVYNDAVELTPTMHEPIEAGTICAAPTIYGWHRAIVTNYEPLNAAEPNGLECGSATVKFLDYGGYLTLPANQLRQLRSDFMQLPFQSIECFLYDVNPIQAMQEEGVNFISRHAKETQLSASLEGYSDEGVPLLKIYRKSDENEVFCLNKEIVQLGYASKQLMEMTYAEAANASFDHNHNHNQDEEIKRTKKSTTTNGANSSSSEQDEQTPINASSAPTAPPAASKVKSSTNKSPNKPNSKYPAKFAATKTTKAK